MRLLKNLKGKILIVEDDPTTGPWLAQKLSRLQITADVATSKIEALQRVSENVYHGIICDIYLNQNRDKSEGLELVELLGKTGIPIIVMTSAADLEIAKKCMNFGARHLLEKPFEADEVLRVFENLWEDPKGLTSLMERFLEVHELTPKEKEIARLLLKGLPNKEIAEMTGNTEKTIKFHITSIFQKCEVQSRSEFFNSIFPT